MKPSLTRTVLATFAAFALSALVGSQPAQAKFVFPYNHPDLDWYSIETEHFVVHYPVSKKDKEEGNEHYLTGEWSARKTAKVSEEMWAPMCAEFNYFLKEKIHIVLLNQSDGLEGFTIPPWDWIEISANKGKLFSARMRGQMEWFSDVLVHEFAHVVSLKANATMAEGTQGVNIGGLYRDGINDADTGVDFFIYDGDSVFWTEGGAEYWSDNTGYNWWTTARDQNIRSTFLQDRVLHYDEWHTRAAKRGWGDSERYYQQGYSFGQYLRQRFGDETYARFALEHSKRYRVNWETVVEDVLGIDAETLYWDWRAYLDERYAKQWDEVKAIGEVEGRELLSSAPEWEFADPAARDEWDAKKEWERDEAKEKSGTWQLEPRVSSDGKWYGRVNRGRVVVERMDDDMVQAFTGKYASNRANRDRKARLSTSYPAHFEHGWDFVAGGENGEVDGIVVTGTEDMVESLPARITGLRFEADGYDWDQLHYFKLATREDEEKNRKFQVLGRDKTLGQDVFADDSWYAIPNTKRGNNPSVSPDGKQVAYFEYTDGTLNLVVIDIDGNNKRYITNYADGTWFGTVDWSPDGEQLVFDMFRNYQQNLYIAAADGSSIKPLMMDAWEEMDPHWAADGDIYFTADPTHIHNIYRYDTDTAKVTQLTNVIGGAMSPQITTEGNLVYNYYTAHGLKIYGLAEDQFLGTDVTDSFALDYDKAEAERQMVFQEDLTEWGENTTKYRWSKSVMAPTAVPMFRLENDSMTNWGAQGGFQVFAQDYVEKNGAVIQAFLGEDMLFLGQYFYQGWYPSITLTGLHYQAKYDSGYLLDDDDDPDTTDDQEIYEIKNQQFQNLVAMGIFYPWNSVFDVGVFFSGLEYGFKGIDDPEFVPYMWSAEGSLFATFSNNAFFRRSANPYFGRTVDLNYTHGYTDVVYELFGGVAIDDGHVLDNYHFNKYELRWTEMIRMPTFGGIPFLKKANEKKHVIQTDVQVGIVDRNVDVNDEFRAGGVHPYYTGYGSIQPNTQFAGYPFYSLSGETMAILNLAYRFPLKQHEFMRVGPFFFYGLHGQISGTAGNLWSYNIDEDAEYYAGLYGDRVAYDPDDVRREIPFIDEAHKNGNYMLYDVSAEVRLTSVIFHGIPWDSFFRLAYGFNEIRGYGDVDGDDIIDTNDSAIGDELSNETELPGLRVYIGLGTGW